MSQTKIVFINNTFIIYKFNDEHLLTKKIITKNSADILEAIKKENVTSFLIENDYGNLFDKLKDDISYNNLNNPFKPRLVSVRNSGYCDQHRTKYITYYD